jgi:hypothetical protein
VGALGLLRVTTEMDRTDVERTTVPGPPGQCGPGCPQGPCSTECNGKQNSDAQHKYLKHNSRRPESKSSGGCFLQICKATRGARKPYCRSYIRAI